MFGRFLKKRRRSRLRVKMLGSCKLEYVEGNRIAFIDGERLGGDNQPLAWYWLRPDHRWANGAKEVISDHDRKLIKKNIEEYMDKAGVKVEVDIGCESN
jgi:hypothetical protein